MGEWSQGNVRVVEKELAQVATSATTSTTLYTAGTSRGASQVYVTVANRSTATTFRVWIAKAGAADDNKQYKAYDQAIGANASVIVPIGGLGKTDLIRVYAGSANLTFTANGEELA